MDEHSLKKILDASLDMFLIIDGRGLIVDFVHSRDFEQAFPPSEFLGRHIDEVIPSKLGEANINRISQVLTTGKEAFLEYSLPINGTLNHYDAKFTPFDDNEVLVIIRDVTEKARIRKALENSEEQYRLLFENNPMPMFVSDSETLEILNVNGAAVTHYGYSKEELLSMTLKDIRPPEDVESTLRRIRAVSSPVEKLGIFRHMKKDGTLILVDVSSHEIQYNGRKARLALYNDVTNQIRAREALEESEEMFRKSFLLSSDSMSISNIENGVLLEVNDGFTETTGYKREEAVGRTTIDLDLWVDKHRRDILMEELGRKGRVDNFEFEMRTKNGNLKSVLLSTNIINLGGIPRRFTVTRDITELKKTEEALLKSEEQLRASLSEKEILLKEIHHRVKNNLQVISGLLDLQARHLDDPAGRDRYKESQNRVITMALIHEKLYQSKNLSQVDFPEYIWNLCENLMVSYVIDRDRIQFDIDSEDIMMSLDTAIPCGLIINELITNSLKHAFPGGRTGTISLSFTRLDNRDYLLTVGDNGVGISRDMDIYKTDTVGMKLVTVIVQQLGGTIELKRTGGTTFSIRFREHHEAGSSLY